MTSLANSRMLFLAISIGMLPYLKTNMISLVPNASACSLARAIAWSGVPQGASRRSRAGTASLSAQNASCIAP